MNKIMKGRKRNSNDDWQEVEYVQLRNSYVITKADQMEFDTPSNNTYAEDEHWQDVRERAAIAAMQSIMALFGSFNYNEEDVAKLAVDQADALIEQLKKK